MTSAIVNPVRLKRADPLLLFGPCGVMPISGSTFYERVLPINALQISQNMLFRSQRVSVGAQELQVFSALILGPSSQGRHSVREGGQNEC